MSDRTEGVRGSADQGRNRVLILAYYFPPMGLSGVQRTLKFAKYLTDFGWEPTVLTCEPRGYFAYDESLLDELNQARISVHRTNTWDPTRLFGKKRMVGLPAEPKRRLLSTISQSIFIPDNKIGWWRPARREAARLMENQSFNLVFSTAPPYSAHLIAAGIARAAGLPLVLDFRDDWIGNPRHQYPTLLHRSLSAALERRALKASNRVTVINDVIRRNLLQRNLDLLQKEDVVVVPQGFDPADFDALLRGEKGEAADERSSTGQIAADADVFTIVYSGVFYDAQTPDPFLRGLADLVNRRPELRSTIQPVFVGFFPETAVRLADQLGISEMVRHTGYLPHREAVSHIASADALWLIVGRTEGAESISTSKMYEYFGARKPILGIVPDGAARSELKRYRAAEIVDPDAIREIGAAIERLYDAWEADQLPQPQESFVRQFDRRKLTEELTHIFNSVVREADATALTTPSALDA